MLVLAQVSDLHIDGGERSLQRARRVMAYLNELPRPVAAVLVTGDVADNGAAAEYETARGVLRSPAPVLVCPGNHDVRAAFREVLLGHPDGGDAPVNQVGHVDGATFVLCDSTIPGQDGGYLADATVDWLDSALDREREGPVFVAMHHPPVALGIPLVDEIRQREGERLERVLRRHPQVTAVLCGHAHTGASTWFAERPLVVAPGTASTSMLPSERPEADEIGDVVDFGLPPAVAFHVFDGSRLTTHYRVIT